MIQYNIINSYNDSRIRVVRNGENKGLPYTRNLGLELATGDYIATCDQDDIWELEKLEILLNICKFLARIFYFNKNTLRYTRYKNMATLSQFRERFAIVYG